MQYHRSKSAVILCTYSKIFDLRKRHTDRQIKGHRSYWYVCSLGNM